MEMYFYFLVCRDSNFHRSTCQEYDGECIPTQRELYFFKNKTRMHTRDCGKVKMNGNSLHYRSSCENGFPCGRAKLLLTDERMLIENLYSNVFI
jgi:hypothetical protein